MSAPTAQTSAPSVQLSAQPPDALPPGVLSAISYLLHHGRDHAFIFMNPAGHVTAWLGAAEACFGYTAEEVFAQPLSVIFTPEDLNKGIDRYELSVARLNSRAEDDRWHVRKDGARFWATGTVNAIRDEAGCVTGFLKIIRDRTEQRSQIETLEQGNAALRDSRERVHQFLSTLGHELRNPLGPLSGAVQVIRKLNADTRVESGIERALQIVSRQVAALTRLADDLMDVARLEAGKVEMQLQTVDLRSIVADAVRSMERDADDRRLTLQAVLPDGELRVQIDENRFQRLVLNLLGNAIKYTPPGGRVWVKATQEGSEVVLRVEDTGIGITPGMLPKIFELFTQDSHARTVSPSGLGVGLAMVREIAELHGGSVQARSAGTGKGAEFTVRLPVA